MNYETLQSLQRLNRTRASVASAVRACYWSTEATCNSKENLDDKSLCFEKGDNLNHLFTIINVIHLSKDWQNLVKARYWSGLLISNHQEWSSTVLDRISGQSIKYRCQKWWSHMASNLHHQVKTETLWSTG